MIMAAKPGILSKITLQILLVFMISNSLGSPLPVQMDKTDGIIDQSFLKGNKIPNGGLHPGTNEPNLSNLSLLTQLFSTESPARPDSARVNSYRENKNRSTHPSNMTPFILYGGW
ncbi:hypothetical protein Fcan01_16625 [Folsomia candida]|uniref:Uncharacterized protein n=1 Tax=Folsomia candida TaxID=158441 RepID=A0A226DV31_FOLCA|nr:hypothetical protein Fcan01_16625 [Folsomia candida]